MGAHLILRSQDAVPFDMPLPLSDSDRRAAILKRAEILQLQVRMSVSCRIRWNGVLYTIIRNMLHIAERAAGDGNALATSTGQLQDAPPRGMRPCFDCFMRSSANPRVTSASRSCVVSTVMMTFVFLHR